MLVPPTLPTAPPLGFWGGPLLGVHMCACVGVARPSMYLGAGTAAGLAVSWDEYSIDYLST
jgi:hypothetical protein